MSVVLDVAGLVLLTLGCLLALSAAVAQRRFQDVASRMHAAAKPQVLGMICVVAGVALCLREPIVVTLGLLAIALQLATSPVSSHMVARSAYRYGHLDGTLVLDELGDDHESGAMPRPPLPEPEADHKEDGAP